MIELARAMSADRIRTIREWEQRKQKPDVIPQHIADLIHSGELIRSGVLIPFDRHAQPTGIPGLDEATDDYWHALDSKREIVTSTSEIKTIEPRSKIKTIATGIRTIASKIKTVSNNDRQ